MKTVLAIILFTFFLHGNAQTDTLYANQTHSLSLFFPSPIRQALPGSGNFTFSYNRQTPQHLGLLQAIPGSESNLLVLTADGRVYSYALKFKKELPNTSRFVHLSESIGHEKRAQKTRNLQVFKDSTPWVTQKKIALKKKKSHFENISSALLLETPQNLKSRRKDGLVLGLKNVLYHNREVYLAIEIRNKSGIDFELECLKIFKINGNKKRKSSYQKRELLPVYAHNHPVMVENKWSKKFVYVVPKFTLGDSEKLLFEMNEKRGSRTLNLKWD